MTAPSPADLRALAERYQHARAWPSKAARSLADDLASAVLTFTDPATTNTLVATHLRREIAEKQEALGLVLARGVSDAVEVGADV